MSSSFQDLHHSGGMIENRPTFHPDISWPIDRSLEVLSLTPGFSGVNAAAKEVGTVSKVSTECFKPLKRFWRWRHSFTQLKQGVNENRTVFERRLRDMRVQCWGDRQKALSPGGTAEFHCVCRPFGTYPCRDRNPALKRWAIIGSPSGTETAPCGIYNGPAFLSRWFRRRFTGILICCTLLVISSVVRAEPLPELTLQQAHESALRNHPRISVADLRALAARQVTREFRSGFFPNLSANVVAVGTANENTRLAAIGGLNNPSIFERNAEGLILAQLITDFGRTANLTGSARLRAQAEENNARATREQILLEVDAAFYSALQAQAVYQGR